MHCSLTNLIGMRLIRQTQTHQMKNNYSYASAIKNVSFYHLIYQGTLNISLANRQQNFMFVLADWMETTGLNPLIVRPKMLRWFSKNDKNHLCFLLLVFGLGRSLSHFGKMQQNLWGMKFLRLILTKITLPVF